MQWFWWLAGLVGVWLMIAPFVLGYTTNFAAMINDIVIGLVMVATAGWLAWIQRAMDQAKFTP